MGKRKATKKQTKKKSATSPKKKSTKKSVAVPISNHSFEQIDEHDSVDLVTRLMSIPGKSGEEDKVVEFITKQLLKAGIPKSAIKTDGAQYRSSRGGNTGNLILKLPGTFSGPRRMLSAHMDTVPICVGAVPRRRGGVLRSASPLTGLGADDRAGTAVLLATAIHLIKNKIPHPPLTFLWTVQEEVGLFGARHVRLGALGKPKLAFNFDGSSPEKVILGATGGYRMTIRINGIASHAGNHPEKGVSAISIAAIAIEKLIRDGWHGKITKGNKEGTSNIGIFHGGEATNVVTDQVEIKAEARSHNTKFREKIVQEIEKAFRYGIKQIKNDTGERGSVTFDGHLDYDAFLLNRQEPSVKAAVAAVKSIGRKPQYAIANGGLDANWLVQHNIPTVSLGCGQRNIHTTKEQLMIKDFLAACQIAICLASGIE